MGLSKVRTTLGLMLILLLVTETVDGSGLGGGGAVKQQGGADKCFNNGKKKCVGENCSCYCQLECSVPPVRKLGRRGGGAAAAAAAVKQHADGGDKCFHDCMEKGVGENCSCYCQLECYVPPVGKVEPLS